jgi:hypothetical protein
MPMIATTIINSISVKPFWMDLIKSPRIWFEISDRRRTQRPATAKALALPSDFIMA